MAKKKFPETLFVKIENLEEDDEYFAANEYASMLVSEPIGSLVDVAEYKLVSIQEYGVSLKPTATPVLAKKRKKK